MVLWYYSIFAILLFPFNPFHIYSFVDGNSGYLDFTRLFWGQILRLDIRPRAEWKQQPKSRMVFLKTGYFWIAIMESYMIIHGGNLKIKHSTSPPCCYSLRWTLLWGFSNNGLGLPLRVLWAERFIPQKPKINQPTNQPTSQPTNQPTNQRLNRLSCLEPTFLQLAHRQFALLPKPRTFFKLGPKIPWCG